MARLAAKSGRMANSEDTDPWKISCGAASEISPRIRWERIRSATSAKLMFGVWGLCPILNNNAWREWGRTAGYMAGGGRMARDKKQSRVRTAGGTQSHDSATECGGGWRELVRVQNIQNSYKIFYLTKVRLDLTNRWSV